MDTDLDLAAAVVQAKMLMRERIDLNLRSCVKGEEEMSSKLLAELREKKNLPSSETIPLFREYLLSQGRQQAMKALTAELLLS